MTMRAARASVTANPQAPALRTSGAIPVSCTLILERQGDYSSCCLTGQPGLGFCPARRRARRDERRKTVLLSGYVGYVKGRRPDLDRQHLSVDLSTVNFIAEAIPLPGAIERLTERRVYRDRRLAIIQITL